MSIPSGRVIQIWYTLIVSIVVTQLCTCDVAAAGFEDPAVLIRKMQSEGGLTLTTRALGRVNDPTAANQVGTLTTAEDTL